MGNIDKYKLKTTTQTIELEGELDRDLRTYVLAEYEIYDVGNPDNYDGTYNLVYKAKLVGSSEVKQGDKIVKGKSKRTNAQKIRQAIWTINPEEEYYDLISSKILNNIDEVIDFLKDK